MTHAAPPRSFPANPASRNRWEGRSQAQCESVAIHVFLMAEDVDRIAFTVKPLSLPMTGTDMSNDENDEQDTGRCEVDPCTRRSCHTVLFYTQCCFRDTANGCSFAR